MNTKPVLLSAAVPVNLFSLPQSNKIELTLSVLLTDTPLARPSSIVHRLDGATCRWSGICEVTVFWDHVTLSYIQYGNCTFQNTERKERKKKRRDKQGGREEEWGAHNSMVQSIFEKSVKKNPRIVWNQNFNYAFGSSQNLPLLRGKWVQSKTWSVIFFIFILSYFHLHLGLSSCLFPSAFCTIHLWAFSCALTRFLCHFNNIWRGIRINHETPVSNINYF